MKSLPFVLVLLRLLLGPIVVAAALLHWPQVLIAWALVVGILSDILDGVAARRLGVATAGLREFDSWTDSAFVACVAASIWILHRALVISLLIPLVVMFGLETFSLAFDWIKYRRFSSYHAYSGKAAGLALFAASFWTFASSESRPLWWFAIVIASMSHLERIAITSILPTWTHDVRSFRVALDLSPKS
jgi:phosphatidylglycerophosphate synthase